MELKLSEKRDAKQKKTYNNFHSLSQLTQTTICTASAYITTPDNNEYNPEGEENEQITIPTKPKKFLLETLACKTGAAAREHFHHHLNKNMIDIDIGMCTSLKNGLFISQPTVSDINTFSINFVPPPSDNHSTEYNRNKDARIMETSKNRELTYADVEKQTKHKNKYAKNYDKLRHFTKNWTELNKLLWTSRSIISENIRQVSTHLDNHELDYRRVFRESEYFGAYFQQKLHTSTQKLLRSCAHGDPSMLNLRALDLSQFLSTIEDDEVVVKIPTWINPNQHLHCLKGRPVEQATHGIVNAAKQNRNALIILIKTRNVYSDPTKPFTFFLVQFAKMALINQKRTTERRCATNIMDVDGALNHAKEGTNPTTS